LEATASATVEALHRFYEHLDRGGTVVLDKRNPYSSGYPCLSLLPAWSRRR
jgi:hypothetical protein